MFFWHVRARLQRFALAFLLAIASVATTRVAAASDAERSDATGLLAVLAALLIIARRRRRQERLGGEPLAVPRPDT